MSGESPDCHLPFIIFSQGNATQAPSVAAGVVLMGKLLVRCPKTGQAIFTGRYLDSATFRSIPVFFSRNYCPLCLRDARVVCKRRMGLRFRVFRIR